MPTAFESYSVLIRELHAKRRKGGLSFYTEQEYACAIEAVWERMDDDEKDRARALLEKIKAEAPPP